MALSFDVGENCGKGESSLCNISGKICQGKNSFSTIIAVYLVTKALSCIDDLKIDHPRKIDYRNLTNHSIEALEVGRFHTHTLSATVFGTGILLSSLFRAENTD